MSETFLGSVGIALLARHQLKSIFPSSFLSTARTHKTRAMNRTVDDSDGTHSMMLLLK